MINILLKSDNIITTYTVKYKKCLGVLWKMNKLYFNFFQKSNSYVKRNENNTL